MRIRISIAIAASAALIAGAAGCRQEGPAEKLGRQIDDATDQARDSIDDTVDEAKKKADRD